MIRRPRYNNYEVKRVQTTQKHDCPNEYLCLLHVQQQLGTSRWLCPLQRDEITACVQARFSVAISPTSGCTTF